MGRRFRRRQYVGRRKNERGRSKLIIFLVLLFTALVVFLSVMLGLRLREKAEKVRAESEFLSTAEPDPAVTLTPPIDVAVSFEKIQADFISVSDPENLIAPEGGALSTVFKSEAGVNFYRSPAVEAISGPQSEELPSAEELTEALTRQGAQISVIFHRDNTEGMDDIAAQAVLEVTVSQMCEVAKAGADEILLMGFDTGTDAANLDFLVSASAKIRAADPDTLVGIVLPLQTALSGDSDTVSTLCRTLSEHFDIIALDMTGEDQSAADLLRTIIDKLQICFARYNIRCILRDGDVNADQLTQVLEEALLSNYQFTSRTGLKSETADDGDGNE